MSSTVIPLPLTQPIREDASRWIAKLERGLRNDEREELSEWASQSQTHYDTLMKMASLWDSMGVLNELSSLFPLDQPTASPIKAPRMARMAVAASFLLCLGFGAFWMNDQNAQNLNNYPSEILTAVGEHTTKRLSDGSVIQLNTNSLIKIDFTPDERRVTLVRGEAHFEVAHAPERPFIVRAGPKSIRAVGTAFNVYVGNQESLELIVTEGKVLVSDIGPHETNNLDPLSPSKAGDLLLIAGEKVAIKTNSVGDVEQLEIDDMESELAWQQGFLVFEGEALESVLEEVSRYSEVIFELADPALKSINIAGFYKARDVNGLLLSLKENFNIHAERDRDQQNHIVLSAL